jgi:hypothetical protein
MIVVTLVIYVTAPFLIGDHLVRYVRNHRRSPQ